MLTTYKDYLAVEQIAINLELGPASVVWYSSESETTAFHGVYQSLDYRLRIPPVCTDPGAEDSNAVYYCRLGHTARSLNHNVVCV